MSKISNNSRILKVASVLHRALSDVLIKEYYDLNEIFSISGVNVSKDLKNADVFIVISNEQLYDKEIVIKDLNDSSYLIRRAIFKHVDLRNIPKLYFKLDSGYYNLMIINHLLKK